MTDIKESINDLWYQATKIRFFSVTYEEFDKARIINYIYFQLKHVFYKK